MKLLVLGAKGMLGSDLVEVCEQAGHQVKAWDIDQLDITDHTAVKDGLPNNADAVINCAAYTRVDDAETNRDKAYKLNAEAPLYLAAECAANGYRFIHLSTDYVFDGEAELPYPERAQTSPLSIYGASKLAGEKAVRSTGGDYTIVRTQSLFGLNGPNFVRAIGKKLKSSDEPLRVVNDQIMAPTYTRHLAKGLLKIIELGKKAEGVIHLTASGSCSWYEFAQEIINELKPGAEIEPISTSELNLPAHRPAYSVLSSRKFRLLTGEVLPTWQEGLKAYLALEGAVE